MRSLKSLSLVLIAASAMLAGSLAAPDMASARPHAGPHPGAGRAAAPRAAAFAHAPRLGGFRAGPASAAPIYRRPAYRAAPAIVGVPYYAPYTVYDEGCYWRRRWVHTRHGWRRVRRLVCTY